MTTAEIEPALGLLAIDPDGDPRFCSFFGKKGWGKSYAAEAIFSSWPYDRLVLDPSGDVEIPGAVSFYGSAPGAWPEEEGPVTLRFVPDLRMPKSELEHELDRLLMLGFNNRSQDGGPRCMLWIDEIVKVAKANQTLPAMDLILQQGRHQDLFLLMCGPRPMVIDPLVISQSDLVFLFRLKGVADRRRIAETTGLSMAEVSALVMALEEHHFVVWADLADVVIECPPLP